MKKYITIGIILFVLFVIVGGGFQVAASWVRNRNVPSWREEEVTKGEIISVVNSTGTVRPVMSVQIGAFVSGPIDPETPLVEFNQEVKKGDVLAVIDQRIYVADVERDQAAVDAAKAGVDAAKASVKAAEATVESANAALKTRLAEVERAKAQRKLAENDESRAVVLEKLNRDFVSQTEMDQFRFSRMQLDEQVHVAEATTDQATAAILQAEAAVSEAKASLTRSSASVAQAEANRTRSQLNRDYTVITSPVDGIVIDRKIEPGQTLAATFQTPELFVIAPNMREEMHVYASVDEADIGLIRQAQQGNQKVEFTVDAYPDDLFAGKIKEVRFSATTTQNVVTYPVIVSSPNPDLKLLPGMTASISFQIEQKPDVLKIPNSALRFYPRSEQVRPDDRKILDGTASSDDDQDDAGDVELSAAEKSDAARKRNKRHVWIADGQFVKAVEVVIGISDSKYTEVVSGDLKEGMKLVTGTKSKAPVK
jgi:HlyD family secretion protein